MANNTDNPVAKAAAEAFNHVVEHLPPRKGLSMALPELAGVSAPDEERRMNNALAEAKAQHVFEGPAETPASAAKSSSQEVPRGR